MDQAAQELITRHNEQIRELIVRDIDALEDRLNLKRQVSIKADEAMDKVKGTLGMNQSHEKGGWAGFVRHNAAPLLAVGLGGTVLARNLRDRVSHDGSQTTTTRLVEESSYVHPGTAGGDGGVSDRLDTAKEKVSQTTDTAKAKASELTESAKARATEASDTARVKVAGAKDAVTDQAVHAKEVVVERVPSRQEASRMAHEHSQVLGLAALAAGALAGTFVPRTRAEERRLAPMQAQVKERAGEKVKETADRAAEAIAEGAETAKEEFAGDGEDQPPSTGGVGSSDLPDLTRPNRITGSRSSAPTGAPGSGTSSS